MASIAMLLSNPYAPDERVYREATSLVRQGHTVTVYAWDRLGEYPSSAEEDGVKIERLAIAAGYGRGASSLVAFIRFGLAVMWRLLSTPFDVLHCHDLDTMPFGYLIARLRGKPVIFDAHEPYSLYTRFPELLRRLIRLLERWLACRADYVMTVTSRMVAWFTKMGVRRVVLVGNYPHDIFDLPDGPVLRPADQPLVLGWIGSLKPDNQLELVIEAVQRFNTRHVDKPLRVLFVGFALPSYKQFLLERARPLGDQVTMLGPVRHQEVPGYYRQIDLAIIADMDTPHNRLALSLKLFEAMVMGVPVIVSPTGETPEVVQQEHCGLVLADYEVDTIVEALEKLSADPHLRLAMARRGWQAVRERYNWAVSEQALFKVYEELLGSTRNVPASFSPAKREGG